MDSLTRASYDVMIREEEGISAKMRQLLNAGLIKEKKDLPFFKSAMKKVKGGTITTVQERQVLLNVLGQFLTMVDEAPEFFNLMRRELAKSKNKKEEVDHHEKDANGEPIPHDDEEDLSEKLDPVGQEDGDVDNDGDKDSTDKYLMKRRKAISKAMKKEDYANSMIKKDEGHKGDKKGGDKMQKLKKVKEDYGFTSFTEFRNRKVDEAHGDYDDDRAMAAQKAQMPASLGGTHKDKSANTTSTQVTKKKSQYAKTNEELSSAQKKLPPALQKVIAKKKGIKKDEGKE